MAATSETPSGGGCVGLELLKGCSCIGKQHLAQLLPHMRAGCEASDHLSHVCCLQQLCSFLASTDAACRQTSLSLLQASSKKYGDVLEGILEEKLKTNIEAAVVEDLSECQSLMNFSYSLLDNFPPGLDCISNNMMLVMAWLAKCEDYCVTSVLNRESGFSLSVSAHRDVCQNALSLVSLILQRLKSHHPGIANALSQPTASTVDSSVDPSSHTTQSVFKCFLDRSLSVVKSEMFSSESQTAASVLCVLVMRLANGVQSVSATVTCAGMDTLLHQVISLFIGCNTETNVWPPLLLSWSTITFSELSLASKRSLLHALVSGLPRSILFTQSTALQNGVLCSGSSSGGGDTQSTCLMLDTFLPATLQLCSSTDTSSLRLLAARLLANIVKEMRSAVSNSSLSEHVDLLRSRLLWNGTIVSQLTEFVCNNWDDPVDALRHQVTSVYDSLIVMHVQLHQGNPGAASVLIQPTLASLLALSWHVRGKYPVLMSYAQHTAVADMLSIQPTLAADVLAMIGDTKLHSQASDLFNRLCSSHYKQLVAAASVADCSVSEAAVSAWQQMWLDPLIHWLCTGSSQLRMHLTEYCLPVLFRLVPSGLTYLSSSLSLTLQKEGDEPGILSALLLCLHHVRRKNTKKMKARVRDGDSGWNGLGNTWNRVLKQALSHSNDEVRLNAIALLCESRQTVEPITAEEFSLLRFFLPYNLTSQDPSFRQRLATAIKKILMRTQASYYAAVRECDRIGKLAQSKETTVEVGMATKQLEQDQHYCTLCHEFLTWLVSLLISCIEPSASFQRCTAALHLLQIILEVFPKPVGRFSPRAILAEQAVVQTLLDHLLMEAYSSNQELFVSFMVTLPTKALGFQNESYLCSYVNHLCWLAASPRAEQCTTSQHLLMLLVKNCVEQGNVQLRLPVHLFTYPSTAGKTAPLPVLTIPQDTQVVGIDEESSRIHGTAGRLSVLTESDMPLPARLLNLWQQYLTCIADRLRIVQTEGLLASFSQCSLYGLVMSLRALLSQPSVTAHLQYLAASSSSYRSQASQFATQCILVCLQLAEEVQPILCQDTPEGYSVDEVSEETFSGNTEFAAKDFHSQLVMVCSWRCLKEVALLLAQLVSACAVSGTSRRSQDIVLLTSTQVQEIGAFFVKQLLSSRHLGAFEKVHLGFVTLCQQLWRISDPDLNQLPRQWVDALIAELSSPHLSTDNAAASTTRRSAGLPPYVQAIVVTEPPDQNYSCLRHVVQEMLKMAKYPVTAGEMVDTTLCQVHAVNILCALFRESLLGSHITPYIADALLLAIPGFAHSVWAVRNSCTHLFRVLIGRIFGVNSSKPHQPKTNRMTGREFFARFPTLYASLLQLLEEAVLLGVQESVFEPRLFPLLLLLSHLLPSVSSFSLKAFAPLVMRCAGAVVWQARVMAAESLVPLVAIEDVPSIVSTLASSLPSDPSARFSHNCLHGTLLQLHHLLDYHTNQSPSRVGVTSVTQLLPRLWECRWLVSRENQCSPIRSLAVDLVLKCTTAADWSGNQPIALVHQQLGHYLMSSARDCVLEQEQQGQCAGLPSQNTTATAAGVGYWQMASGIAAIAVNKLSVSGSPSETIPDDLASDEKKVVFALLHSTVYEAQLAALQHFCTMLKQQAMNAKANKRKQSHSADRQHMPCPWLFEELADLFLNHTLQSSCLEMVVEMLAILSSSFSALNILKADFLASMIERCQSVLSQQERSWSSFGHVVVLLSHLLTQTDSPESTWQTWLHYVQRACDDALSWDLHMFAVQSFDVVLAHSSVPASVWLSAWSSAVMLLQDEHYDVRLAMSSTVLATCISTGITNQVHHVQPSRCLRLALVVMQVQCVQHHSTSTESVLSLLRHWSRLSTQKASISAGLSAGQLFQKSSLNSFFETSFLEKEATTVLAVFSNLTEGQSDVLEASQRFMQEVVLGHG